MAATDAERNITAKHRGGKLRKSAIGIKTIAPTLSLLGKALASTTAISVGGMVAMSTFATNAEAQCNGYYSNLTCSGTRSTTITRNKTTNSYSTLSYRINLTDNFTLSTTGKGIDVNKERIGDIRIVQSGTATDSFAIDVGNTGIELSNTLTGATFVNLIKGLKTGGRGIDVSTKGHVTVSARNISAGAEGIWIPVTQNNYNVTVSTTGLVSAKNQGVYVKNSRGRVTITLNSVHGGTGSANHSAVNVIMNGGTRVGRVTATGTLSGSQEGLKASLFATGNHVFQLNNVSGGRHGVHLVIPRVFSLTSTGTIQGGTSGFGVYLQRGNSTSRSQGDVSITVSAVSAGKDGIRVSESTPNTSEAGKVTVSASDHVEGTTPNALAGIYIDKKGRGDVKVTAEQVTGGRFGVLVGKYNSGAVEITVSGDVLGKCGAITPGGICNASADGAIWVYADSSASTVDVDVKAAGSVSGYHGIYVSHAGTGTLTITAAGEVDAIGGDGIFAKHTGGDNLDSTPAISISAKDIQSTTDGIHIFSQSEGDGGIKIDIAESADITVDDRGIFVDNREAGGISVSLSANAKINAVEEEAIGIKQSGDGNVSITASTGSEINSFSTTTSGGVTTVSGDAGISIYNAGTGGTVSVNLSGNIKAKGDGIFVYNKSNNTTTITTNGTISEAREGSDGIYVNNTGSGNISITISGGINGGGLRNAAPGSPPTPAKTGYALNLNSVVSGSRESGTGTISVTVNSGTISAASTGGAIKNGNGNATINFQANASLNGKVSLGQGTDLLSFSGSVITATTELDGGTQTGNTPASDILTFEGGASTANNVLTLDPAKILNWERINLNESTVWRLDGTKTITTTDFSLTGSVSLQDAGGAAVGDALTFSGGFNGNGTVLVDVNFVAGTSDTITVSGNLSGTKSITIREVSPNSTAARTSNEITVVTVSGTAPANGFSVTGGSFTSGGIPFTIHFRNDSKTFVLVGGTSVTNCRAGDTGVFTCSASITSSEVMVANGAINLVTTLDGSATTNVASGVAFVLTGGNAVSFTQETGGRAITGGSNATGIVHARTTGNGNLEITTVGAVTLAGSGTAIKAASTGTGNVSVDVANVTASHASGKAIEIEGRGDNVSLSAATIVGNGSGVVFKNTGNGSSNVTITGSVTSSGRAFDSYTKSGNTEINVSGAITSSNDVGFYHTQGSSSVSSSGTVSITTGSVKGTKAVIVANYGEGAMTITVNGSAESTNTTYTGSAGIEVFQYGKNGVTLNVGTGGSAKGRDGIYLFLNSQASGTTTLNLSGDITGENGEGIQIESSISGDINITVSGNVTGSGGSRDGIAVDNSEGGVATVIINSGTITGSGNSIWSNSGKIDITVNSNGVIASGVSLGENDDKLTINGANLALSTKDFDGGTGTGTDILTINNVSATLSANKFDNWEQIIFGSGTNITFDGTQTLTTDKLTLSGGIITLQDGATGDTLTLSKDVEGNGTINVDANLSSGASDSITISGNLTGAHKIFVNDITPSNASTPAQSITLVSVTGTASANAFSLSNATLPRLSNYKFNISYDSTAKQFKLSSVRGTLRCIESTQTAGQFSCSGVITGPENMVVGSTTDISATLEATSTVNVTSFVAFGMEGGGDITFTQGANGANLNATGTATGVVHAKSTGNGDVSITITGSASLAGSGTALLVESTGTGSVIVSAANVTAEHSSGTAIKVEGKGSNVSLAAANIIGSAAAVFFKNTGDGSSNIDITGTITSSAGKAFYSYTKSGNTTIVVSGAISSSGNTGFDHVQGKDEVVSSGTVSITTGSVKGIKGIVVTNYGEGAMTVTVNGDAESTDTTSSGSGGIEIFSYGKNGFTLNLGEDGSARGKDGIYLFTDSDASGTITANVSGDVTGVTGEGIDIRHNNSSDIDITISADITGSADGGISIENADGGIARILVNSGTITSSGNSVHNNSGKVEITVNANGVLASGVDLEQNDDKLTFNGSNPSSSSKDFDGGAGTDVVTFKNLETTIDFSKFTNWEEFGFDSGAKISFDGANILSVATVRFTDTGTISLQDSQPNDSLTISGNVVGSGTFSVDTNLSTGATDTIVISGNFSGTHKLVLNSETPDTATVASASITVFSVTGTTSSSALTLNGVPRFKGYLFELEYDATGTDKVFKLVAKRGNLLCVASTQSAGHFACAGTINAPETLITDGAVAIRATLASDATVSVSSFKAISLSGEAGVSFTQSANGGTINATGDASGTIDAVTTGSGDVSVTLTGTATLQGSGIAVRAASTGTGAVSVSATQVTANNSNATAIEVKGSGSRVSVSTSSTVSGGENGIRAINDSSGAGTVTVVAGGTVTGSNATAIFASNKGTGGVTVTAGAINAGNDGVDVVNFSGGSILVTVSGNVLSRNVSGYDGAGIAAVNDATGDGISIVSQGSVKVEGGYGIHVYNHGTGNVSVTSDGEIEGTKYQGLYTINEGNNTTISVKTVLGVTFGMDIAHYGTNTATIDVISGGSVTGDEVGLRINSESDVILTASGTITGTTNDGIYATQNGTANLTLNVAAVVGGTDGIQVVKSGAGIVSITATGAITSNGQNGEDGVYVSQTGSGNISVTVGAVSAGEDGIDIKKTGTGDVTVTATGAIASSDGSTEDGVYVGSNGVGNVSVTVAAVNGDTDGIDVRNFGGGRITVSATGSVVGTGSGDKDAGIFVYNDASGRAISVSIGTNGSLSGHNGIVVEDEAGSSITINASGAVTGVRSDGIYVAKTGSGIIRMTVAEVTGKKRGLKINHTAGGNITATATKLVKTSSTTEAYTAIEVTASGGSIGLALSDVTGTKHGVEARTNGAGSVTIVTSGTVAGRTDGIRAFAEGRGNVSLTISGNITAGAPGVGIDTKASNGTTTIVINDGEIGGFTAIQNQAGASIITVNNDAELKGNVELGAGIDQLTFNSSKFNWDVRLDGGEDPSTDVSVDVLTFSSGSVTAVAGALLNWERIIVASGATLKFNTFNTVISEEFRILGTLSLSDNAANDGLIVTGNLTTVGGATGSIAIDTNFATGVTDLVTVQQNMTGKKTLIVNDITPTNTQTRFLDPIKVVAVLGSSASDALTLSVPRIRSGSYYYTLSFDTSSKSYILQGKRGVLRCSGTNNSGTFNCSGTINEPESIIASGNENLTASLARTATVSVSADVAITVSGKSAVSFTQEANGGTINATGSATGVIKASTTGSAAVSVHLTGTATLAGAGIAVEAKSTGTGNVTITATNVVASNAGATAILAEGNGGQVNLNLGTTSGGRTAVMARNKGTNGSIVVTANGTSTGNTAAIDASSTSGSVTISAAAVTGRLIAKNAGGSGNVTVATSGDVTGAGTAALMVENLGSGSIAVSTSASVTGSGTDAVNIVAGTQVTRVNLSANSVSGVRNAVRATNQGGGDTTIVLNGTVQTRNSSALHVENTGTGSINITIAGAVTGGTQGAAVDTITDGGATNIILNSGATLSATSGIAVRNDEGASVITVNAGATISGSVLLGAGVDTMTFADPKFGNSILDGGRNNDGNTEPVDVLTFNGGTFVLEDDRLLNWEKIVLGSQATITIAAGESRRLNATDLELSGTISLQDGSANNGISIHANIGGGGTIKMDVDFYAGSSDLVNIVGNVAGTIKVDIRDISTDIGGRDDEAVTIINFVGTASASSFEIVRNAFSTGAYDYELSFDSENDTFAVTKKQAAGSVMLVATPIALFDGFARASSLYERRSVDSNEPYWSRVFTRSNGYGNAKEGSAKYDASNTGFQIGYDIATTTNELGTLVYGATVQYNTVDADVSAFNVPGTLSAQGFGIGGTATLYRDDGIYVDGQIQFNKISSDFEVGNGIGSLIEGHDSSAFVLSAEAGRRYAINDEYTLLYNGQLIWGSVDSGNGTTPTGTTVDFGGDSGLTIRGGARLEYLSGTNNFYGLANIYIDTMDSWDVTFAEETYSDSKASTFVEIGGGADMQLSPSASLFAHLAYKTSLKGGVDKRDSTYLSTGVRWSW